MVRILLNAPDKPRYAQDNLGPAWRAAEWVDANRTVTIAGHEIAAGLFYVGLASLEDGAANCPKCCIDPTLLVAPSEPDICGRFLSSWPSYATLHPQSRLAYLVWQAGGRKQPDIHPGYVLLFLFGLERRLVLDRATDEARAILAEVERLAAIYGHHRSVRKVVKKLADIAELLLTGDITVETAYWGQLDDGVPLGLKLSLGRAIRDGRPVTPELVLLWVATDKDRAFGLPADLDMDAFASEFSTFISRARPAGLVFNREFAPALRYTYHSASNAFSLSLDEATEALPDIEAMPLARLEAGSLVRYALTASKRQRRPERVPATDDTGNARTIVLPSVLPEVGREAVQKWARERLSSSQTMPLRAALKRYRGMFPSRLEKGEIIRLADVLGEAGIGIVPDPRFDIDPGRPSDDVVLFALPHAGAPVGTASADYRHALILTMVCMSVARSDGRISPEELDYIERLIGSFGRLHELERVRLRAEMRWMQLSPLPLEPVFREIRQMDNGDRLKLADIMAATARADGITPDAEVRFSEALFAALGIPKTDLHRALHIPPKAPDLSPALAVPGPSDLDPSAEGSAAAPSFGQVGDGEDVDDLVIALFEEAHILDAVADEPDDLSFAGGDDEAETLAIAAVGLNRQHLAMLAGLLRSSSWKPFDLAQLARTHRLFADGAIEAINEWAFDEFEDRLFEFEESGILKINPEIDLAKLKRVA